MFYINDKCFVVLISTLSLTSAFNVFVVPDQEEDEIKSTDMPTEEIPTSTEDLREFNEITLDVGEYTTIIYQYEKEQYMARDDTKERCFNDYTRCLTSLVSGIRPVCAYNSQYDKPQGIRTFRTVCDMYVDNCYKKHRHYRILDYGKCIDVAPYEHYNKWSWTQFKWIWYRPGPWLKKNFDVVKTK